MADPRLAALDPAQLVRAWLRLCWDLLSQVGERLDLLPVAARLDVADALSTLALARAAVEHATAASDDP